MLVGSVPNAFRVQSRLRFLRGKPPEDDPTHLRMFSPDAIRALLAELRRRASSSFVGGRYTRLNARLFARDLVFARHEVVRIAGVDRPETRVRVERRAVALAYQVLGDGASDTLLYLQRLGLERRAELGRALDDGRVSCAASREGDGS